MKKVADGLRESGNYGTAHIYRSSMSAILAFNESGNLPFRKVTPEFLKVLKRICVEEIVAGIRFPPICAHYVQCITERLTDILLLMCLIIFVMSIQGRGLTENVHWTKRIWND